MRGERRPLPPPEAGLSIGPLLGNPYLIAGCVTFAAIVVAVLFVIFFGGSGGGVSGDRASGGLPSALTPGAPGRGVAAKSIATASVREGPSTQYLEIGTLRRDQEVEVVGRNPDASWFQIYFPPRSQLRGWVPATALRVPDASIPGIEVVAATPIARPTIAIPTATPAPVLTPTPEPTDTPVPTPAAGPDLVVTLQGSCVAGQPLSLMVRNAGGPIQARELRVTVATPNGLLGTAHYSVSLDTGAITTIQTSQVVQAPRTTATVELLGAPADANPGNNTVECAVQGGGVTPTGTPSLMTPVITTPTATPQVVIPPPLPTSTASP